jgi:hypothetical protein
MRRHKVILILTMLPCASQLVAQRDSSLTSEFARMSARERTRIAREEGTLAEADTAFQAAMRAGEEHFRGARYHEALERFQRARDLRPLNVHPKVKIQDLQALLARRMDADREHSADQPPPSAEVPRQSTPDTVENEEPRTSAPPPVDAHRPVHPAGSTADPPRTDQEDGHATGVQPVRPATVPIQEERMTPPPAALPAHEGHRIFREGRAVVEERVVQEGGRAVVWRKVLHPWGEVVHFRDNEAIPERRWQERFAADRSDGGRSTGNRIGDR